MTILTDTRALPSDKKRITVYGASSSRIDPVYVQAARAVGHAIALAGAEVVNGGGATGLMGATADGALEAGGTVTGIIPRFMTDRGWGHKSLTHTVVTDGMHPRKQTMAAISHGTIALPGGIGTFEELLEIITWRQLHLYDGPVVILNTAGYYDPLLQMIDRAEEQGFMRKGRPRRLFAVTRDPTQAVALALGTMQ